MQFDEEEEEEEDVYFVSPANNMKATELSD